MLSSSPWIFADPYPVVITPQISEVIKMLYTIQIVLTAEINFWLGISSILRLRHFVTALEILLPTLPKKRVKINEIFVVSDNSAQKN